MLRNGTEYVPNRPGLSRAPADLPLFRWPKFVGSLSAAVTSQRVSGKGWVQFGGVHSGYVVSDAADGPGVEVFAGEFFPAPSLQRIYVKTVGSGVILLREWDEEVGALLAPGGVQQGANAPPSSVLITTRTIKSDDPISAVVTPASGSKGITIVNRPFLSGGVTVNTHNLTVGGSTITAAGLNGSVLVPGQSYNFPAGQSFYFIPDQQGASQNMVVELDESV